MLSAAPRDNEICPARHILVCLAAVSALATVYFVLARMLKYRDSAHNYVDNPRTADACFRGVRGLKPAAGIGYQRAPQPGGNPKNGALTRPPEATDGPNLESCVGSDIPDDAPNIRRPATRGEQNFPLRGLYVEPSTVGLPSALCLEPSEASDEGTLASHHSIFGCLDEMGYTPPNDTACDGKSTRWSGIHISKPQRAKGGNHSTAVEGYEHEALVRLVRDANYLLLRAERGERATTTFCPEQNASKSRETSARDEGGTAATQNAHLPPTRCTLLHSNPRNRTAPGNEVHGRHAMERKDARNCTPIRPTSTKPCATTHPLTQLEAARASRNGPFAKDGLSKVCWDFACHAGCKRSAKDCRYSHELIAQPFRLDWSVQAEFLCRGGLKHYRKLPSHEVNAKVKHLRSQARRAGRTR